MKQLAWFVSGGALVCWSLAGALAACGGSTADDSAITNSSDGGSSSSSTSSSSSSSSGGSSTSSSGGTGDGGGITDGGTKTDGGSSSGTATPNKIACGTATCNLPAQKCCTSFGGGGTITQTCIAAGDTCQNGANATCDDKTDCPTNEVCCIGGSGGGGGGGTGGFGASCKTDCGQGIQMCKAANECIGDAGPCTEYTCFGGNKLSLCRKPAFGCQ